MGEFELIARIRERVEAGSTGTGGRLRLGIGDDAALTGPDKVAATTVDSVVEGVHFDREWAEPPDVGHKAVMAATSDIAAMGAEPGEVYLAIGVPPDLDEDGCMDLYEGACAAAESVGFRIAGGDVTRSDALFLTVTAVGYGAAPEALVTRSGASPGEAVVVTGEIGGAAAGLAVLRDGAGTGDSELDDALTRRQLRPRALLKAGAALARLGATAMIDVSDGLGADAGHIAEASQVELAIEIARVPIADGVAELTAAVERAVAGGEDYELLATLPKERLEECVSELASIGIALTEIGAVNEGAGVALYDRDGTTVTPRGFDQLPD